MKTLGIDQKFRLKLAFLTFRLRQKFLNELVLETLIQKFNEATKMILQKVTLKKRHKVVVFGGRVAVEGGRLLDSLQCRVIYFDRIAKYLN